MRWVDCGLGVGKAGNDAAGFSADISNVVLPSNEGGETNVVFGASATVNDSPLLAVTVT